MAALKKVVLKSTTVMSLNERFTYLRQPSIASTSGGAAMAVPTALPNLTSPTARDMATAHLQHLRPSSQQANLIHRQPHISPQQYRQQQYDAMRRRQPGIGRRGLDTLAGGYDEEDDSVFSISPRSVESPMRALRSRSDYLLPASARNRRLAAQMERRPAVVAALKLKKRSVRQRLGQPFAPSIKDRLTLGSLRGAGRGRRGLRARSGAGRGTAGRGGVGRGRTTIGNANRRGNLNRSQSRGALNRNNDSGTVPLTPTARQGQGFRRPFARGGPRRGGALRTPVTTAARFFPGRGRAAWRGSSFRSRRGVAARRPQRSARGVRRGARGGRGRGTNTTQPTREELDHQLDEYMAGTRSHLDKELDQYMNQASGDALESWD